MWEQEDSMPKKEPSMASRFYDSELKGRDWDEIYNFITELREIATKSKNDWVMDRKDSISREAEQLTKIDSLNF